MGRGRTSLNRIEDEKVRKTTLKIRSKTLMKKVSEISTKCDAETCLIVYDGDGDGNSQPTTWPNDTRVITSMLEKYKLEKKENPPPKFFDLKEYYINRIQMTEAEIHKVKKEIWNIIMYPIPTRDQFKNIGKEQLKEFAAMLDAKIGACNQRLNMLKNKKQSDLANFSFMQNMQARQHDQFVASSSAASHPNQFSFIQNISPRQSIMPAHMIMNPHNYNNGMIRGFSNPSDVSVVQFLPSIQFTPANAYKEPEAILGLKMVMKGNLPAIMVLIQWKNEPIIAATWEFYSDLLHNFPSFHL